MINNYWKLICCRISASFTDSSSFCARHRGDCLLDIMSFYNLLLGFDKSRVQLAGEES
jgi:hypothetical protein